MHWNSCLCWNQNQCCKQKSSWPCRQQKPLTQYSDPVLVQSVKSLSPTNTIPQKLARMDSAHTNLIISSPILMLPSLGVLLRVALLITSFPARILGHVNQVMWVRFLGCSLWLDKSCKRWRLRVGRMRDPFNGSQYWWDSWLSDKSPTLYCIELHWTGLRCLAHCTTWLEGQIWRLAL